MKNMKIKENYPNGILVEDVEDLKAGTKVLILEDLGDSYRVKLNYNTPPFSINKTKIFLPK